MSLLAAALMGAIGGFVVPLLWKALDRWRTRAQRAARSRSTQPRTSTGPLPEPLPPDQIALKLAGKPQYAGLSSEQRDLIAQQIHDKASHLIPGAKPRRRA